MKTPLNDTPPVDLAFEDLFDAYRRAVKLESATNAITARREAKKLRREMELAIDQLVGLGAQAGARWRDIKAGLIADIPDAPEAGVENPVRENGDGPA